MIDKKVLREHLLKLTKESFSYKLSTVKPHVFAEKNRVLSSVESPSRPGPFSYEHTPLTKEIIDCLSADCPVNTVAIMKSAQYGVTEGLIINGLLYIISENPGPTMFLSGDQGLSQGVIEKRLDPAIHGAGLHHLLQPTVKRKAGGRSGDTSKQKEFRGGFIIADGILNLEAKMRQETIQYGFYDDWERAPRSTKEGGDSFGLTQTRMQTLGYRRKAFYISTPEIEQSSTILPLYLRGDQRKWFIPCPCCNEDINLEWVPKDKQEKDIWIDGKRTGVIFETNKGKVVSDSIKYRCQKCGGTFTESEKFRLVKKGKWMPTAEASESNFRSYHINALYSPPGQKGWLDYCQDFQSASPRGGKADPGKLHVFNNTVLGLPWREKGRVMKSGKLARNTRSYDPWIIPDGLSQNDGNGPIVLITLAVDLNGQIEDGRIDWEIIGWSRVGPSYSIAHGSIGTFQRSTAKRASASLKFAKQEQERVKWNYNHNTPNSVWPKLVELADMTLDSDIGEAFTIDLCIVDVSQTFSDQGGGNQRAYQFLDSVGSKFKFYGAKGDDIKIRKADLDKAYYKKSRVREDLYILDVDTIKDDLSIAFESSYDSETDSKQPYDFCNFPTPSEGMFTAEFFDQFSAEERRLTKDANGLVTGFKWVKRSSTARNHFLDCRVYNMFARQFYYTEVCKSKKILPSWENCMNSLGL